METTIDPSHFSLTTLRAAIRILEDRANALWARLDEVNQRDKFPEILKALMTRAAGESSPFGWVDEPALAVNYAASLLALNPGTVTAPDASRMTFQYAGDVEKVYAKELSRNVTPVAASPHDELLTDLLSE